MSVCSQPPKPTNSALLSLAVREEKDKHESTTETALQVHGSDKAARYLGLLESARLNGKWSEVPELVRKVDKHAPQRKCPSPAENLSIN